MLKFISLLLSFSLVFTSVAPSYAQALQALQKQRSFTIDAYSGGPKTSYLPSSSFDAAVQNIVTDPAWQEEVRLKMSFDELRAYYKDWVGSEYKAKELLAECEGEVTKALNQADGQVSLAQVCHEGTCLDAISYGRACVRSVLNLVWDGKGDVPVSAYQYGMESRGYTRALGSLVSLVGAASADKNKAFNYFAGVLGKKGICEKADDTRPGKYDAREPKRSECEAALKGLDVLGSFGQMYPEMKTRVADLVYGFMKNKRREQLGAPAVYQGVLVLMGLDSDYAYNLLEKFLVQDSRPTYAGTGFDMLGYLTLEGITSALQENKGNTAGRYLNGYTARFNYLDTELSRKWFGGNVCETYENAVSDVRNSYQCPHGNLYEDIGMVIARDVKNSRSQKLAREIWRSATQESSYGRYPAPLLAGLLVGDKGAWTYAYGGAAAQKMLKRLQEVDFTDMNEGTQRRLKQMSAEAVVLHEKFVPAKTQAEDLYETMHKASLVSPRHDTRIERYEKRDLEKFDRYKTQQWHRSVFGMLDLAVLVIIFPKMLVSLGIYGARGAVAFSSVTRMRGMAALSERALKGLKAMNTPVLEGKGVGQKAARLASQHPNVSAPMHAAERVNRVAQIAKYQKTVGSAAKLSVVDAGEGALQLVGSPAAASLPSASLDMSRLTVGLGEATVSSTNRISSAVKTAAAAPKAGAGVSALGAKTLPVTHRVAEVTNSLGQTLKGYVPVNPAPLTKPSLGKMMWSEFIEWGANAGYDAGQIFSGLSRSLRSRSAALALWMSLNMTPSAAVAQTALRTAAPVKTELVVMQQAAQTFSAVPLFNGASAVRGSIQFANRAVETAAAARAASSTPLISSLLFVPAVATPDLARQFGRFYDSKQKLPGSSLGERYLPQFVKDAVKDYQKQIGAYNLYQQSLALNPVQVKETQTAAQTHAEQNGLDATLAYNNASSGYLYSGIPIYPLVKAYNQGKANRHARSVLKMAQPLVTELRDILQGKASESFKKQALLRLYGEFNVFDQTIKALPDETRHTIASYNKAKNYTMLGNVLYSLFQADIFAQPLARLSNHIPFDQFAKELETIISSPDFAAESRAVYDNTPVLSAESNLFTGVTEGLKGVDKEAVLAASRSQGWAVENASSGREVRGGWIYHENNIPIYYRNASGELSKTPPILLRQDQPSFYGSLLAWLKVSTPKGLKIPKGMALAMDENGKIKYVRLSGHLAELETSKAGKKQLKKIYSNGSSPVSIDVPYSTTDLLAIAKMLEQSQGDLNFQLTLAKPNSFKLFVNMLGAFFGMNVDNVMVGPFKEAAKSVESQLARDVAPNLFGGVGYVTPRIAGAMVPSMQKWGLNKATFAVLMVSLATLASSTAFGINGINDPANFSLVWLAAPMVVLVMASSLLRSAAPLLLNHYKNPQMRTAANLNMSSWQQGSRLVLSIVTAAFATLNFNEFVTVPIALLMAGATLGLFLNTPLWESMKHSHKNAQSNAGDAKPGMLQTPKEHKAAMKNSYKKTKDFLTTLGGSLLEGVFEPVVYLYRKIFPKVVKYADDQDGHFQKAYDKEFATDPETKNALTRVTLAYGSYAASVMLLSQLTKVSLGGPSNFMLAGFMLFSWLVRFVSSKLVASGKFTDDQLTGVSFQGLMWMPIGLALMSAGVAFTGWSAWYLAALIPLGIGLNMSTAVPGQLDNTRLQNNVTAAMQKRQHAVLQDASLSAEQKKNQIDELVAMEKYWTSQASKSYSNANANGIRGIYVAVLASMLPVDWFWMAAIVFAVSGGVAAAGAAKTSEMAKSFWNAVLGGRFKISEEDIAQRRISAKTFEITDENKARVLANSLLKGKENSVKTLKQKLAPSGVVTVASEIKMTGIIKRMVQIYNRLVAASEMLPQEEAEEAFEGFYSLVKDYGLVLKQSNLSESLHRQFAKLTSALCIDGALEKGVRARPGYIAEGDFEILQKQDLLLRAQDLITEMRVLARYMRQGGNAVNPDTYRLFIQYHNRAQKYLQEYMQTNPSESSRVKQARERIERTFRDLKKSNTDSPLRAKAASTPEKDIQNLEDMLQAY